MRVAYAPICMAMAKPSPVREGLDPAMRLAHSAFNVASMLLLPE